jgi:hypothetical protein
MLNADWVEGDGESGIFDLGYGRECHCSGLAGRCFSLLVVYLRDVMAMSQMSRILSQTMNVSNYCYSCVVSPSTVLTAGSFGKDAWSKF